MSEWNSCGILRHSPQSVRNLIILDCIPTRSQSMGATEDRLLPLVICFEELTASSKILKEGIPQNSLRIPGGWRKKYPLNIFFPGLASSSLPIFSKVFFDQHFSETKYFSKHFFTPPHVGMEFLGNSVAFPSNSPKV